VVEDNAQLRSTIRLLLEAAGYDAVCVGNGREALDHLLTEERPALILVDCRMPVMGGEHFRAEQLKRPGLEQIPVILMSADPDLGPKAEALQVAYLVKPIDAGTLLASVKRHVGG
jgi:two-component system response regulator (stage 0 sporulation protein F)/two-component system phosphate regulon response regulator PhoB